MKTVKDALEFYNYKWPKVADALVTTLDDWSCDKDYIGRIRAVVAISILDDGYEFLDRPKTGPTICPGRWTILCTREEFEKEAAEHKVIKPSKELPLEVGQEYELHNDEDLSLLYGKELIGNNVELVALYGRDSLQMAVVRYDEADYCFRASMLRPAKTERERFIEVFCANYADMHANDHITLACNVFDSGKFKLVE